MAKATNKATVETSRPVPFDMNSIKLRELKELETHGVSIASLADGSIDGMIGLAYLILHRENPEFTWEDAEDVDLGFIQALASTFETSTENDSEQS